MVSIKQKIAEAIRNNADSLSLHGGYQREQFVPKTLLDITGLRHLNLEGFCTDMPAWPINLNSLESLEIEEAGSVKEIVPFLWKLGQLRKLKLAFVDDLTELPASLARLVHLEELNVDGADFETFPAIIAYLTSLQSFSYQFCDCPLPEVFGVLSALPRLKILRLTHGYGDGDGDFLPESFCRLQAIEELYFNHWNNLQELPECIGDMHHLRVLNLSNDDYQVAGHLAYIKELPDSLCSLPNLEELDVYGLEDLKQFPPNFARLSRLKRLDVMSSGIDELQLTPEQWKNLETLRMHGPLPDFRQCVNLKEFAWLKEYGEPRRTDEIINLPLSPLRKLESLSIFGGVALKDTTFLASLTNLRNLHLNCDFENFPEGFEKLDKLERINIWGAKSLTVLPEYIGHFPSFRELRLTDCGVKHLPQSVRERKDLRIDVRGCPVKWPE